MSAPVNGNGVAGIYRKVAIGLSCLAMTVGIAFGGWVVTRGSQCDERIRQLEMQSVSIDERLASIQALLKENKEDHQNIKENLQHLAGIVR